MKKIAFMFVAAALVAACGETKKPAEEVEAVVEEVVATAEDSAAAEALVADADSLVKDSLFQVALDSIVAAKAAPVEEATEAPAEEVAE